MSAPLPVERARPPRPIAFPWWVLWMFLLVVAWIVFYGFFTPAWVVIRLVARISERRAQRGRAAGSEAAGR